MDYCQSLAEWAKDKPLSILQLDPADRAVLKIADERDAIQKKTFTKWVNKHLKKHWRYIEALTCLHVCQSCRPNCSPLANKHVDDLFEDLRDGHNLISLLEVLSTELLPRERGRMRFHMLQNVQIALDFLRYRKIKLVNIRAEDIVDGNPKLTLGLIWTIILHFQISDIITGQTGESLSAREALLRWAQSTTDRYPGVKVSDFTRSWRDGLAFNAIIHRNRPDIMDFRAIRTRTARENLESAFTLAEREFGVTKLLDPEDVDTPEPDEKSLITYISSLYDVFPVPPSYHPFSDDEKRHRVEDYRELASSLHHWIRESTSMLQDRNFPNTLVEMKALLAECTRFRVEDVPPRLHDKQRLSHIFREMKKTYRDSPFDLEAELHFDSIERRWNKMMQAHQDRDQIIHEEIARLEKLQRLAEKLHREAKQCDSKLDDIERHISEEEKRFQRLHPMDAKANCDQIEADLKNAEESIKSMNKDVQTLKDGRYHQAIELQRRVQHLHERWVSIRMDFQSRLLTPLSSKSYKTEERKVSKQRTVISESRLVETNETFRFLQECIEWVNSKLKFLDTAEYGSDLPSVQQLLDQHQTEHRLIDQFQRNIDQCDSRKNQFKGEEFDLYCKLLNKLAKGYSELLVLSNKRLSDLETLYDFIQSATNELIWMNDKEEIEVSRDWSAKNLNLVDIEQYQESFTNELERREVQFNSVQDRGESLVLQKHPAAKCIEAYLAAMNSQWSLLLQLTVCLQLHLKHASNYHQFFNESKECEQWLKRIDEKLNTTYSRQSFSIDEGERLLKEMQEVREDLTRYGSVVSQLIDRSKDIVPLKQRRQPLPRPLRVVPLCSYKQLNMSIVKDEQCWLHDNSQKVKWKVINSQGTEGMVPAVCFLIPPPNTEAIDLAESLKRRFDMVVQLWAKKQHRLRLNMIFATIKIVKEWDLAQFRAMGPSQREAIMKALNEDADKLLSEGDRNDPQLKRLQEEIDFCNRLFQELMQKLRDEEEERSPKSPTRKFNDLSANLQPILSEKERILNSRIQAPIPRDLGNLEVLVIEHKEFESELRGLEPQVNDAKAYFNAIKNKTPALQTRYENMMDTWERIWSLSHLYIERLKSVEISVHSMDEASRFVSTVELQLTSYDEIPPDVDGIRKMKSGLNNLKDSMENQQSLIDQLPADAANVRRLTERSRPKQTIHSDVNKLEEDVRKLTKRFDSARNQINERLRSCEAAAELMASYQTKAKEEKSYLNKAEINLKGTKSIKVLTAKEASIELETAKNLYTSLADKKGVIERVNVDGGRFIRETKIYDDRVRHYRDQVVEFHPEELRSIKKPKVHNGAELVTHDLDDINNQYTTVVDVVVKRINDLTDMLSRQQDVQMAVEEKYKICNDSLSKLVIWLSEVEQRLAEIGAVQEDVSKLQHQILEAKAIRENLDDNQKPVLTTLDNVRQLVQQGQDVLSNEEIQQLQKEADAVKKRYDSTVSHADKIHHLLTSAMDELQKFSSELQNFIRWINAAQDTLVEKERSLGDLSGQKVNAEITKSFVSDVISHQADLRFITMAAQKFLDESKEFLRGLNDFRTNLPRRLSHIEFTDGTVKTKVSEVTIAYQNLLNRVNRLSDRISTIGDKQRHYMDCVEKANAWLAEARKNVKKLMDEPVGTDLRTVQEQLDRLKALHIDVVSQGRLIENVRLSAKILLESLEGTDVSRSELQAIEDTVRRLDTEYQRILTDITERSNDLQQALVHCQDIQDSLDRLLKWLDDIETSVRNQSKPVSLIRERLDEQYHEYKILQSELDSQKPSIEALNVSSRELMSSSNQRLAKKVETKLKDLNSRFEKVNEKVSKRGELLEDVSSSLEIFEQRVTRFDAWFITMTETIEARELSQTDLDAFAARMEDAMNQRNSKKEDFEELLRTGRNLVSKRDVTDTTGIKEKLKQLEQLWKELGDILADKQNISKQRAEQLNAYKQLRAKVLEWLNSMETKVDNLDTVAVEKEVLRKQAVEVKALVKEHTDYAITIDKVNDLGNNYDAMLRGESPRRKASSPIKKASTVTTPSSPTRKMSPSKTQSPLSSISSGFSSRRNSSDNFGGLDDISPIQQQLSEINNRYHMIGVKLNDRQQEIDTLSEDIKRHFETLKILSAFVQAKERQMPKDTLPVSREQAEKFLQILREISEEMQEKQSDLDRLKTQTNELQRLKPNAEGITTLKQQVTETVTRWTELQMTLKERMAFLQDLKDFQDTHDILTNWLSQKDKMFQVLGPIASEPRMVNAQMQQVQVMREEFSSQQTLLSRLDNSGHSVLDKVDVTSSAAKKIKEQMTSIHKRWVEMIGQLEERERSLNAASGATKDFHDSLKRLQESLTHISEEFDMVTESNLDIDEQLRKLGVLEEQLESQRPLLADAESVCEHLCDILSDSASKSEIKNKLSALEKQYTVLTRKMNNRKAELESSMREDREFFVTCEGIQHWLSETEGKVTRELRVSADFDKLNRQLHEFEPVYREVQDKEHEIHMLLTKGADIVSKTTRKTEAAQIKNRLDTVKKQWDKIRKCSTDRHTRLQGCLENCKKFHSCVDNFIPFLEQCEDKLTECRPASFYRADLDRQIKEMQSFKNELSRHSQEFDNVKNSGENVVTSCDSDKDSIKGELDQIKRKWDRANHGCQERLQTLEEISQRLSHYQDQAREVNNSLQRMEDKLSSLDTLGDTSRDPKLLNRVKSLLTEAEALNRQLDNLKHFADQLISEAGPGCDTSHISDEVDSLSRRHRQLTQKLEDKCSDLESATEIVTSFNGKMRTVHHDLNSLEEELDSMSAIGRDSSILHTQINEIKDFASRLLKARDDIEEAEHQCREIISQGFTPDPKGCRHQVDNLIRQLNRLEERSKTRETNLETMLTRVETFFEELNVTSRELKSAINEEHSFRQISAEVEIIRVQQEQFMNFRYERIEPLSKQIDELNKVGQALVQSAASGVNTSTLEQSLESLNDKWNGLKERLNERERRLDAALLQSGKFQEALAGVLKWLQDTEEMVANQRAPSADYKVVKAQLQEQKFLNKLLHDRQNGMSSLMSMGIEVMKNLEPSERNQIDRELKDLNQRFEILTQVAQERMDSLERTIPVAKEFQERIVPLGDWLELTEKKLSAMATIPTEQDKIRRRIQEHNALHEDILGHKANFEELTEIAQTLMSLVGDDEAQTVVEKLQEITNQYARVVEESETIGQLLADAHEGVGAFSMNFEDILAWIEEMDSRLSRFKILSVFIDKLQEQMDELMEVTEEIADHQKQIGELHTSGQEIMKHASGDDAIQIKDKLDTLQVRFSDLTNRAADRLKNAQDAVPLVHNFHGSYDRLSNWLDEAERALKNLESVSLSNQEETVQKLETELQECRSLLESVNHLGPQLCHISPGEGAAIIESSVSRANRRFDAVCEQVQRKAERIELSKQRNMEVIGDIDDLLDWFRDAEKQVMDSEPVVPNPDILTSLLKEQKTLNEEVSSQKGRVRDILAAAKKLMRESSSEDLALIRDKADILKETTNAVTIMCGDRLSAIEQALPLAEHFYETHNELSQWMDDVESETELLEAPVLNVNQIKKHQDKTKALLQSVNDHKPLVDKLNKTGVALAKLCNNEDGERVKDIVNADNSRYNTLRNILRERQNALEEALQATSQFSDKLDGMLNALSSTADQLNSAEPISAHPERIQEQINDNKAVLQDLDKRSTALAAVKKAAADVITKAGNTDEPAVKDIKTKLNRLNDLWENIQKTARNRGRSLEEALAAAEKFWEELTAVMKALKELQDNLNAQEPPAVEPNAIQQQQEVLLEIRQEIDQTKPEVDQCRQAGQDLMQLCGEPDKPEVKKHIEDLDNAWENVTTLFAKREKNLVDAMEKAMNFHDTLQNLLEFLDTAEEKFAHLGPLGSDIESVKGQINQLKNFKKEVDPHMVEVEALNRQAQELMERTSSDQAIAIREPMAEINRRWDDLLKGIVERQRELENALLRLGQFQHALDELLVWISKTERTLDDLKPVFGDPQIIEVELAKHKVLMNDIQAHQTSVDTLNRAGRQLIESDRGSEDANVTQRKLNNVNSKWQQLQDKAATRQRELEEALKEAQAFNQEIQDLLLWLSDLDGQLVTSKPVGGLPETARDQLGRFMELYNELDSNRHKIESVLHQGQDYMKRSNDGSATSLQHNLKTLKQRWENVLNRANDRKIKLEIALREATEFHEALQEFVEWLTNSEKYLGSLKPVSRVMDSVLEQIEEHKAFQKDVGAHREIMLNLDKKGTHLKYFSQKQDVILIKNLLISVQHRWERVVSKAAERTRALDHGYKESKEFHDAWKDLIHWLDEADKTLDDSTQIGNDPEKIKKLLAKHKEFQRTLGSKQPTYDITMKLGRTLKDKCPKMDVPTLQEMMDDLKNKWNSVCNKSVDRQRKLEEALLFSGQFKDAVQALIDWLEKSQASLSQDQPVHGDLDTVVALMDQHKNFQEELKNRSTNLESVRRTANDLLKTASADDAKNIRIQLTKLETKWEEVVRLSDKKQTRLEEALKQAEILHKSVHMLLEWLSDAEMKLRFAGPLPEDEETTRQQIAEHQKLMREMADQESNKDATIKLAQEILQKCHPDAVSVIRHWITIIQSRWDEVSLWAKQREQRLQDHLRSLRDIMALLEELMAWLILAEANLTALEAEPLPDDLPTLEGLIKDHDAFMADMSKKQPDVEQVTKAFSAKRQPPQASGRDAQTRDRPGVKDRKTSSSAQPKTSTPAKTTTDPEIKNPRARELLDKWRHVWLLAMERQRRLQDKYNYLKELDRIKNFDFDEWRRRFLAWMNNKKSRIMDLFRKIDKDNDGKVTREEFIEGILKSKFPTSRLEMERVAEIFDRNGDGYVDHKEYLDTLRPDRENRPLTEAEKIQDEVQRQVAQCTCAHRFKVYQVGEGKYRFGDSQKLRLVRILRSTVMVRVGGGWVALDEFLVKNDPCRAKGRTNLELREQFILAEGVSQSMTPFKSKPSPNSSQSSQTGNSFTRPLSATGPITKVREKTDRSVPMGRQRLSQDTSSDLSGPSFSETDSAKSSAARRVTPNRLAPPGLGSKSSSRTPSRPSSRPSSRPASRAGSDLSTESVEAYRNRRAGSRASTSSQPGGVKGATTPTSATNNGHAGPTKIPTVRRTSSNASSSGRPRAGSTTPDSGVKKDRWR